ncbi:natural cytotoxicity triggering receptor 2-like isoform X1 [Vombatus ursinus]|uniref:Ig-like domain-containing protein n=1 Tax=Vombatus ursinus TaxID=29139 RepID=A0A4X2M2W1_VOMUR|nr:natural cytotoxicity triggering receptor 2-like isoform X1 [Vombatus ursinus]XP_027732437.1 natural cytotoxicity triggering receptor 2-like isoform X1 [Vombatus ursinus]
MMAQAAPLLLLLPLLLIGSQGQVFPVKYQEGQTLRVNCSYNLQRDEKSWKSWCKVKEDGTVCNTLIIRKSGFPGLLWDTRASLADDTYTGRITITMSNLRVKDSGIYWCGIHDSVRNTIDILRTIRLEVSPATTSKITKHSQTTTETSLTTSAIFLATSSPRDNQKFIIWGSVLVSLLLVGLLSLGIIYIMKVSQKPGTGDDDCHHVYDDLEEQKQKTRNITIEMQDEGSEVIRYASVVHGTQLSLGDSIYANTQMGHNPDLTPIRSEPVVYASIARTGRQLPK